MSVYITYQCPNCMDIYHFSIDDAEVNFVCHTHQGAIVHEYNDYETLFPHGSLFHCPRCKEKQNFIITF